MRARSGAGASFARTAVIVIAGAAAWTPVPFGVGAAAAAEARPVLPARPFVELTPLAVLKLGATADWVSVGADAVWVGSTGPDAVHRIDPRSNRVVAVVALPGEPCAGLAEGFGSLWIPLCTKPTSLARVDLARNALAAVYPLPLAGEEAGVATGGDSVWVVADARGTLLRVDPANGRIRQRVRIPPGSYNPHAGGDRIWVTQAGGTQLTAVDAASGRVSATVRAGPRPRFLAYDADTVWTLNQGDGSVSRIDARTQRLVQRIPLGLAGRGGDIEAADGLVWATLLGVPLSVVDASRDAPLCQWSGAGGDSLGVGHGSVWLTDYRGGRLARYDVARTMAQCRWGGASVVGAWRLVEYEDRAADGRIAHPYGLRPAGQVIYDASGEMSIQIMKVPHPRVASGDEDAITDAEKLALFDAYTAYFGRWRVDPVRGVVLHEVEGDVADVFIGRSESRPLELDADRLVLAPCWDSGGTHWCGRRVFRRVAPAAP